MTFRASRFGGAHPRGPDHVPRIAASARARCPAWIVAEALIVVVQLRLEDLLGRWRERRQAT